MGKGKGKKKEKEKEKKTAEGKAGEQSLQSLREIILQMHESFHEDKWAELKEKAVSKLLSLSPRDPVGLRVHAETTVRAFEKANQAVERLNRNDPSDPESKQRSLDELADSGMNLYGISFFDDPKEKEAREERRRKDMQKREDRERLKKKAMESIQRFADALLSSSSSASSGASGGETEAAAVTNTFLRFRMAVQLLNAEAVVQWGSALLELWKSDFHRYDRLKNRVQFCVALGRLLPVFKWEEERHRRLKRDWSRLMFEGQCEPQPVLQGFLKDMVVQDINEGHRRRKDEIPHHLQMIETAIRDLKAFLRDSAKAKKRTDNPKEKLEVATGCANLLLLCLCCEFFPTKRREECLTAFRTNLKFAYDQVTHPEMRRLQVQMIHQKIIQKACPRSTFQFEHKFVSPTGTV